MKKMIKLLLCLCAAAMLLPMTVLAGMGNNGVMSGTGTWGIDIDIKAVLSFSSSRYLLK